MAYSDRELLARLIKCEAGGEGDTGMRAVASVVMNRVDTPHGEYQRVGQGNLKNVIYQPGQFDCVETKLYGKPNPQNIYATPPEPEHYRIADWAIGGGRAPSAADSLWYMNPFKPVCMTYFPVNRSGVIHNRIVQHCFYRPTNLYKLT